MSTHIFMPGDPVKDVETGQHGTVVERVTLGQLIEGRPWYPHVYNVAYDDGVTRSRMAYHLSAVTS